MQNEIDGSDDNFSEQNRTSASIDNMSDSQTLIEKDANGLEVKSRFMSLNGFKTGMLPSDYSSDELNKSGSMRLYDETILGQRTVNWIIREAARIKIEDNKGEGYSFDPPDDWLVRFFKYASEATDDDVRRVFARALDESRKQQRKLISPRALDTLRFFESTTYDNFDDVARYISLFGSVPTEFLEKAGRTFSAHGPFDLQLLLEMGLIKLVRQKWAALDIGSMQLLFTYKTGERFEFELVTLTKIGLDIAGLMRQSRRKLLQKVGNSLLSEDNWIEQKAENIKVDEVKMLAASLIERLMDTWAIDIDGSFVAPGVRNRFLIHERPALENPFDLRSRINLNQIDTDNQPFMEAVLLEFEHFDEKQLPSLIIAHQY